MVFSSTLFLFIFLNVVLIVNFLLKELRNIFLLIASLFFYAWGEHALVFIMISSICFNYTFGLLIEHFQNNEQESQTKMMLFAGIAANLSILIYYKYFGFILENISFLGLNFNFNAASIALPVGVSFFTFQNISYLIDVYRKTVKPQKNLVHLGLYISLFPQLIAGPIVRYVDICKEIKHRVITKSLFVEGLIRFIRGMGKKVLIANNLGLIVDKTFAAPTDEIGFVLAWLAIICYSLQIYFDFSGYSDMAIGIGKMLGFNFKENFNYPYIATSVKEFWRRWHISLSTWFRDYLYIPLGGNRKGNFRTYVNLLIVFFITGIWHGASWNFIVWGLFHGTFLLIERNVSFSLPKNLKFLSRIYLLLVVMISWVLFRAETLEYAIGYIKQLFTFAPGTYHYPFVYVNNYSIFILCLGILFATPLRKYLSERFFIPRMNSGVLLTTKFLFYILLFSFSILELSQSTYNPFIYYRF